MLYLRNGLGQSSNFGPMRPFRLQTMRDERKALLPVGEQSTYVLMLTSDALQEVRRRGQVHQREHGGGRSWPKHLRLDLPGGGQGLGEGEEGCATEGRGQQAFPGGQRPNHLRKCNT